jgi:hypothetical protein
MLSTAISPQRRDEILDALRRGTVPSSSLDAFAVGLERFEATLEEELRKVSAGGSMFKAVRGEYGCGNQNRAGRLVIDVPMARLPRALRRCRR